MKRLPIILMRTRDQLIKAIEKALSDVASSEAASAEQSTSASSAASAASASASPSLDNISNEALKIAYQNNFCVIPRRDDELVADQVASQIDALLRDTIEGGVKYPGKKKLGLPVESSYELKQEYDDLEEIIAFSLKRRFGDNWAIVLLNHSQLPAYLLPSIIKNAIHNSGQHLTISIDLPDDSDISTEVVLQNPCRKTDDRCVCQFITRIQQMRITDNETKATLGYIEGPIMSIHSLREMKEKIENKNHPDDSDEQTVWRYQLDVIQSENPLIIDMFEGKMFSQMDLPDYTKLITDNHSLLLAGCNAYLDSLLLQIGKELAYKYDKNSTSYATLDQPRMKAIFENNETLPNAAKWCEKNVSARDIPTDLRDALIKFVEMFRNDEEGNRSFATLVEQCTANPELLIAKAKHVLLTLELIARLNNSAQPLNVRITHFEELLLDKQSVLKHKPNTETKIFIEEVNNVLDKLKIRNLLNVINRAIRNDTNIFASTFNAARRASHPDTSSSEHQNDGKKSGPKSS